jgi:hypothetical protein
MKKLDNITVMIIGVFAVLVVLVTGTIVVFNLNDDKTVESNTSDINQWIEYADRINAYTDNALEKNLTNTSYYSIRSGTIDLIGVDSSLFITVNHGGDMSFPIYYAHVYTEKDFLKIDWHTLVYDYAHSKIDKDYVSSVTYIPYSSITHVQVFMITN